MEMRVTTTATETLDSLRAPCRRSYRTGPWARSGKYPCTGAKGAASGPMTP